MTVLEAAAAYIGASLSGFTVGTNVFMALRPDSPDRCITVYETPGFRPVETMADGVQVLRPGLQVVCRASFEDYPTARDDAVAVRDLLAAVSDATLSGVSVMRVAPISGVLPMGPDQKSRPLVSVNFDCWVLP